MASLPLAAFIAAATSTTAPQRAFADVQYELGPLKMYTSDDPKINPKTMGVSPVDPAAAKLEVTERAFMKLEVDGQPAGAITFDLYGKDAPKTVENFSRLVRGEGGKSYKGSSVFRIIPGINIGFGDIAGGGDKCVKAGTCVSALGPEGGPMPVENYDISHSVAGLVSMARGLDGTVDSRFFVTLPEDAKWADGRYTAFARVGQDDGSMDVLAFLGGLETTGTKNAPKKAVRISDCGIL